MKPLPTEYRIAVGLLIFGLVALGGYVWVATQNDETTVSKIKPPLDTQEQIILPAADSKVYRRIPEVIAYRKAVREAKQKGHPFVPLSEDELQDKAEAVQAHLMRDQAFNADAFDHGKWLHNDMMRIVPAMVGTMTPKTRSICAHRPCYQAEKYNFVTNTTTRAVVALDPLQTVQLERFVGMQSEISRRLRRVAEAIALKAPEVRRALGFTPTRNDISMPNVRGNMQGSICEDTTHLCVAPVFPDTKKGKALWAAVDLTTLRLAAAKWAPLGKTFSPSCIHERILQNRYVMEHYCQKVNRIDKEGWHIEYVLTGSDGLEIRNVTFRGKPRVKSAKIVDWHVAYAQQGKLDPAISDQAVEVEGRRVHFVQEGNVTRFGYNDAMGCPMFSTSVVLPFNGPHTEPLPDHQGFALIQDFRNPKWPMACNYRYENRFEFYRDGSFRIVGVNKGRGCAANAYYRPVMRIDLGLTRNVLESRHGEYATVAYEKEGNLTERNATYPYRFVLSDGSVLGLVPDRGQFPHSRGDFARMFLSRFHENEGATDMLTLGSCCKLDEDGPERFLNGEMIQESKVVVWYVPHIQNDAKEGSEYCWADSYIDEEGNLGVKVWPCAVGPKFVPIKKGNQ